MTAPFPGRLEIENATGITKEAQEALNLYLRPGLGSLGSVQAYTATSQKYDQYMEAIEYEGPRQAASALADLYPDVSRRAQVRILDVAAGTGLLGVEMQKLGFKLMDALDPSEGMLKVASSRGIYGRIFNDFISDKPLPIQDNNYDALVISGGMGENMIPCAALPEMVRLVKPGGYIVNVLRAEHLQNVPEFHDHLEQQMEELAAAGRWRLVSRSLVPNFVLGKDGLVLVHQVLA